MHVIILRRGTARNEHARRELQTELGASADCYIHVSQAYRQEEKFAHRNCIHSPFPYVTKISGRVKVCALCSEKEKKTPPGRAKKNSVALVRERTIPTERGYGVQNEH